MNIATRVIATMRTVVKTDPRIIFIRVERRLERAERRIAQVDRNQNEAAQPGRELNLRSNGAAISAAVSMLNAVASTLSAARTNRRPRVSNRSDWKDHISRWRA